jgi:hypothetical protein
MRDSSPKLSTAIAMAIRLTAVSTLVLIVAACAGVRGQPETVQRLLREKYVGKQLQEVLLDLGAPDSSFQLDDGRVAYTWCRQTDKYKSNVFIKSDERCVITMLTDETGRLIETIGKVDDSLGAWRISYCAEQLGL